MLLIASYFFYGCWDWRFLSLILISSITDYFCGLQIEKYDEKIDRRKFVLISLFINLGILAFFKYFNFFVDNFIALVSIFGIHPDIRILNIILPVGISFYTFQTLSYTIDVYRKQVTPCNNFLDYALYVSFFPQLVAGPIERAKNLLPQVLKHRSLDMSNISEGLLLIYWGLFKKIFIADNLALIVDSIFAGTGSSSGGMILLGIYAFSFQIYCDFSAYSDIARGVAKLMGFEIMINFREPFFASNIQDFWNRWHISLTTWIRDYLYYPLALTRIKKKHINVKLITIITFLVMGLWHGASWNFVLWGGYHGSLLALYIMLLPKVRRYLQPHEGINAIAWKIVCIIFTFHICAFGCLLFRSQSLDQVLWMVEHLFKNFEITGDVVSLFWQYILYILPLLLVELGQFKYKELTYLFRYKRAFRYVFYSVLFYLMTMYSSKAASFIYFQF